MHRRQLLIAGGSLFALSACASTEETPYVERPVETIYSEAAAAMEAIVAACRGFFTRQRSGIVVAGSAASGPASW